jgi:HEAT repeat protein
VPKNPLKHVFGKGMQMQLKHAAILVLVAAGLLSGGFSQASVQALPGRATVTPAQRALELIDLDHFGIPKTVPGLRAGLRHPDALARRAAATGLGGIGTPADAEAVQLLLNDPDRTVIAAAIKTLLVFARVQGHAKSALLLESLRSPARRLFEQAPNVWAQMEAAALLADARDASEVGTLLDALTDKERQGSALQLMDSFLSNSPEYKGSRFADWSAPLGDVLRDEANPRHSRALAVIVLYRLKNSRATAVLQAAKSSVHDDMVLNLIHDRLAAAHGLK